MTLSSSTSSPAPLPPPMRLCGSTPRTADTANSSWCSWPEKCDENSEAYKAGYKNICEIGKERIRRAGEKIKEESPLTTQDLDIGFRVLKLDDSNMKDVYYAADDYDQQNLMDMVSNIKEDRTDLDLLFGCLLDWGLPLSLPYTSEQIDGWHRPHLQRRRPDRLLRPQCAGKRRQRDRQAQAPAGRLPGQQLRQQPRQNQCVRDFQALYAGGCQRYFQAGTGDLRRRGDG